MKFRELLNPGRLILLAFLVCANLAFSQKANIKPEVYVPVPMEELPFFNDDQLALEKARQISDFQVRILANATSLNKLSELPGIMASLNEKRVKLCPNYPGINVLEADRLLIERWVLEYPIEVVYFDEMLNTVLYRINEEK